ncbi:MAG: 16S rRNA (guanine(527)-N(7))-methyltransferase RsmG [Chitinophagaceae bacterium]
MKIQHLQPLGVEFLLQKFPTLDIIQKEQLQKLYSLYEYWNQQINVISRKDFPYVYEHHVWHSLFIAQCFDLFTDQNIIDIGTGGGFPGIPLAIYFPETQFFLVDSIGKKIKVVKDIVAKLQLKNVIAICDRVENLKISIDTITARSLVDLASLCKYGKNLLKKKNTFSSSGILALKGGDLAQEIQNAQVKPQVFDLHILSERHSFFKNKYLLFIKREQIKG